ncbi:MAG TPA: AAA family ATPase [Acidimicrobiales bacterium]
MTRQGQDHEPWLALRTSDGQPELGRPGQPGQIEPVAPSNPIWATPNSEEPWVADVRTAWEASLEQQDELRASYPGGKDEFFARLWDEPSRSDLQRFGPLCGVSLHGRSTRSFAPDADASPQDVVEGLRMGILSPHLVSADVVAGVVRQLPRDLWLRGDWEDIVDQHGEWALDLAERVGAIEAHRGENRLRRAIITEDSGSMAPPVDWLIEDMFVAGDLVAVTGRRSAGTSALAAVDLACCVATGEPWLGHRVEPGRVIVFVAEGSSVAYQAGVRAWRAEHPDAGDPWSNLMPVVERISLVEQVTVSPDTVNLDSVHPDSVHTGMASTGNSDGDMETYGTRPTAGSTDLRHALELIGEEEPALVVIDDLLACMDGRSGMSPADVSSVLSAMQHMAEVAGSTVAMVRHTEYDGVTSEGLAHFDDCLGAIAHVKTRTNSTERFVECYKPSLLGRDWPTVKLRLVPRGGGLVFVPIAASDTDAIHDSLDALRTPAGKNAILEQAKELGFRLDRNRALRLIDELADDPDDRVARDGIMYYLEGSG